jgi:hypothetical protein
VPPIKIVRIEKIRTVHSKKSGFAIVLAFGVLAFLLIAAAGQVAIMYASRTLALKRMRVAVARADARYALGQAIASLSKWPGMDDCATASGDIVSGTKQPRWTLCEKSGGARVYLVSSLPDSDKAATDVELAPTDADAGLAAVSVPSVALYDADGGALGTIAWWADDLGVKIPLGPADGRDAESLYSSLKASEAIVSMAALHQQMPGVPEADESALTTNFSAFTLVNAYDGGFREDLSALADTDATAYTHAPADGVKAWMDAGASASYQVESAMKTSAGDGRFEPIVTEFALTCGLGANLDSYKSVSVITDIYLTYYVWLEIWNPYARTMALGDTSPDLRIVITGLPSVTAISSSGGDPTITLPDPFTIDTDCYNDLAAGYVQLLANPKEAEGDNAQGAWQVVVGSMRLNKYNTLASASFTLSFASSSPIVKFYDISSSTNEPFMTLKLDNYAAFTMNYNSTNRFCRSPANTTSYGMGRDAMNGGGWAFAYHYKLIDDDLDSLLRDNDPREETVELDASSGGDSMHYVLKVPSDYDRDAVIQSSDFFDSSYSGVSTNRRALFCDPPADEIVSMLALRHAPLSGKPAFAIARGVDEDCDANLDRYYFSTLPSGAWDGKTSLKNYRLIPADDDTAVTRSPSDASGLLLQGGWNINTASAAAWKAILSTLAIDDWTLNYPAGSTTTLDMTLPVFSMPWAGAYPPTSAAADTIADNNVDAWNCEDNTLAANRLHPSYLVGARNIGDWLDDLATEIVALIKTRAKPFHSLTELAQSKIVQDAIDSVPEINQRDGSTDGIPASATAHVDQSELLCALSPILFTRSDTFRIRIYGREPVTGVKACGEAIVQRTPTAVNGDAAKYGRAFKIVSLRWLCEDEL